MQNLIVSKDALQELHEAARQAAIAIAPFAGPGYGREDIDRALENALNHPAAKTVVGLVPKEKIIDNISHGRTFAETLPELRQTTMDGVSRTFGEATRTNPNVERLVDAAIRVASDRTERMLLTNVAHHHSSQPNGHTLDL